MTVAEIKRAITRAFALYAEAIPAQTAELVPTRSLTTGKLYEAYVLGAVAEKLTIREDRRLRLSSGSTLSLKSSPGPINPDYPRIDVCDSFGQRIAEMWTDVEFLTLSYARSGGGSPRAGEYHELDIAMVEVNSLGRPSHDSIRLGVECKHTSYTKNLLRQTLGVRRELSLLVPSRKTTFTSWPRAEVPAVPESCLLVYSTDPRVRRYNEPAGRVFGIDFVHEPL